MEELELLTKEEICRVCENKLQELFGNNIPKEVQSRYEYEIKSILENNFENIYMLTYLICKKVKEDNEIVFLRGKASSSFVVYLLGISIINPIQFNIPFEEFGGINGDTRPFFELDINPQYIDKVNEYIEELSKNNIESIRLTDIKISIELDITTQYIDKVNEHIEELSKNKIEPIRPTDIKISKNDTLTLLKELENETKIKCNQININDKNLLNILNEENGTKGIVNLDSDISKEIIEKVEPKKINDLIKIVGLINGRGVWLNNNDELIKVHSIEELVCSRDDVFIYLQTKGINKEISFKISEFVRKGKRHRENKKFVEEWKEYKEIMKNSQVPEWYISSIGKVKYMMPKSLSCNLTVLSLMFMWYKIYYLEEFNKIIK